MRQNHADNESIAAAKISELTAQLLNRDKKINSLETELAEAIEEVHKLTPHIIEKKGKRLEWDSVVTQLIMEHLANRTPPTCICPNILATLELIIPNYQIMVESPGIRFVRYCRTVAVWCTKTIGAFEVALSDSIIQAFFDGTSRRQIEFNNFVANRWKIFFVLAKPERSLLMVVSLLKMVRQRPQLVHSRLASSRADNT
eukprot:scaffold8290_cov38-Cyclotella_meneghiniana.AAC.8